LFGEINLNNGYCAFRAMVTHYRPVRAKLPAMLPELAIVIVTHNSAHVIGDLLDSLPAALDGLTADVVVVDNASADGTADLLAARGGCRVVRSANIGYAGGINLGVREAMPAEAILILNPDVRLYEQSVPPLVAALQEPNVGIVAPQVRSAQGTLELSLRREPTLPRALGLTRTRLAVFSEYVYRRSDYASPRTADWALGAVLAMSRKCYDTLGGWDETYFLYSEETDLALRARDAGLLTRYEPRAVAVHIGGQSGRSRRADAAARGQDHPRGATAGHPPGDPAAQRARQPVGSHITPMALSGAASGLSESSRS